MLTPRTKLLFALLASGASLSVGVVMAAPTHAAAVQPVSANPLLGELKRQTACRPMMP